jgi:hypothetical protein
MLRRILGTSIIAMAIVLVPLAAGLAADEVRYRIPFNFVVNNTTLEAGQYTLSMRNGSVLLVEGKTGGAFVFTRGLIKGTAGTPARAVFEKVGDQYYLVEAWGGGRDGQELIKPSVRATWRIAGAVQRIVVYGS